MGLPVVSTRHSGIPEVVHNQENGMLVEPEDATGLADALGVMLDDPMFRERLGQNGQKTVKEAFSIEKNAARLLAEFQD